MTNKEAIDRLTSIRDYLCSGNPTWRTEPIHDAINMAVDALRKIENSSEKPNKLVNDSQILAKDLVDGEFNPYDEECMRCKHLKLKCEFIPTYCKFESRDRATDGKE